MVKEAITEDWEVEKIIAKRGRGHSLRYQVKWRGFGDEDSTWEPRSHLESCKEMVENFERKYASENGIRTKKLLHSPKNAINIENSELNRQKPADLVQKPQKATTRSEKDIDYISDVYIGTDNEIYGEVIYKDKDREPEHLNILVLNKYYPNLMCDYYYKHISFAYKPKIEFEMKLLNNY